MKKIIFLFCITLSGFQNPICQITDFSPAAPPGTLKTISISLGPHSTSVERCTIWINSPNLGQVQIACYLPNNPIPVHNEISVPTNGMSGSWIFADGEMSWLNTPGGFQFVGWGSDHIEVSKTQTF